MSTLVEVSWQLVPSKAQCRCSHAPRLRCVSVTDGCDSRGGLACLGTPELLSPRAVWSRSRKLARLGRSKVGRAAYQAAADLLRMAGWQTKESQKAMLPADQTS